MRAGKCRRVGRENNESVPSIYVQALAGAIIDSSLLIRLIFFLYLWKRDYGMNWLMALLERCDPTERVLLLGAMGRSGISPAYAHALLAVSCAVPVFSFLCGFNFEILARLGPLMGLISVVIGWSSEVHPNPCLPIGWMSLRRIPCGPSVLDFLRILRSHAR